MNSGRRIERGGDLVGPPPTGRARSTMAAINMAWSHLEDARARQPAERRRCSTTTMANIRGRAAPTNSAASRSSRVAIGRDLQKLNMSQRTRLTGSIRCVPKPARECRQSSRGPSSWEEIVVDERRSNESGVAQCLADLAPVAKQALQASCRLAARHHTSTASRWRRGRHHSRSQRCGHQCEPFGEARGQGIRRLSGPRWETTLSGGGYTTQSPSRASARHREFPCRRSSRISSMFVECSCPRASRVHVALSSVPSFRAASCTVRSAAASAAAFVRRYGGVTACSSRHQHHPAAAVRSALAAQRGGDGRCARRHGS